MTAQVYPSRGTPLPRYSSLPDDPFSSVHRLSSSSSSAGPDPDSRSVMTAPPPYDTTATPFLPTLQLQIETPGKPILSFPLPLRPDPIPVFTVPTDSGPSTLTPAYLSLRPTRSSGSCFLIDPSTTPPPSSSSEQEYSPLSTTTYRFGPNRPPLIRLYLPNNHPPTSNPFLSVPDPDSDSSDVDLSTWDTFTITSPSLLSRTIHFRTRLGTFTWSYDSRSSRKSHPLHPSSLLTLHRIVRVARADGKKDDEIRTPIAQFIRNEEFRSEGSSASSAGNGGRLMVDLRLWEGDEGEKGEREMAVVMVVTTAMVMLKKEVDRRRTQQIMVMAGAGSGGP